MEEEELRRQIDEGLELCIGKVSGALFGVKEATDGTHPSLFNQCFGRPRNNK